MLPRAATRAAAPLARPHFLLVLPSARASTLSRRHWLSTSTWPSSRAQASSSPSSPLPRSRPVPKRDRERIQKGRLTEVRTVPEHIARPDYSHVEQYHLEEYSDAGKSKSVNAPELCTLWRPEEVELSRRACKLAKEILAYGGTLIKPGVTTEEIDSLIHAAIVASGAYPSPLHYEGYPKSCCTSINEVMCHGIPDSTVLRRGDIMNLDVTVFLGGFHGDCSATFIVGNSTDKAAEHLVQVSKQCLDRGIAVCRPGVQFQEIGRVIEKHANRNGLSVVPEFAGHGVGRIFHSPPFIFHFSNDEPGYMQPEPVVCEGPPEFQIWRDNWTAVSLSGGWSAQFEHTVLITADGCDVLTL